MFLQYNNKQFTTMKSITIYPDSDSQFDKLKNLLEEMRVDYITESETDIVELTETQKSILSERIISAKKGNVSSREEAKEIFIQCMK